MKFKQLAERTRRKASLVFESNSHAIKSEAKPLLNGLARALGNLLGDAGVRDNIDAIVIQRHTDERGSASFNWDLSAKRATAVLDYLFSTNKSPWLRNARPAPERMRAHVSSFFPCG